MKKKKEKGKKKAAVMHSGRSQSGLQGQLYLTVVHGTTNGAFISCESRGCSEAVKSALEMMSVRLSCCFTVKECKKRWIQLEAQAVPSAVAKW